jgi:hypothetical protein
LNHRFNHALLFQLWAAVGLSLMVAGCVLPYNSSFQRAAYPRTDQNHRTNELLTVVSESHGWFALITPEGPQPLTFNGGQRYYFSDRHVRRRNVPFLTGEADSWETILPVEGTNCWVQIRSPVNILGPSNVLITVFTPQHILHHRTIDTKNRPTAEQLHFTDGNRVIRYKAEDEEFIYEVLENRLSNVSVRPTSHLDR